LRKRRRRGHTSVPILVIRSDSIVLYRMRIVGCGSAAAVARWASVMMFVYELVYECLRFLKEGLGPLHRNLKKS
jgi:hypothetical protein